MSAELEVLIRVAWAKLGGDPSMPLVDIERFAANRRAQFVPSSPALSIDLLQQIRLLDSVLTAAKLCRELAATFRPTAVA